LRVIRRGAYAQAIAVVLPMLVLTACSSPGPAAASSRTQAASDPDPAGLLAVPPDQLAHLKIAAVRKANWAVTVRTTGTVDWNADRTTPVITQVSGPVARIVADTGQAVEQGQPLLYVSSPDVSNAVAAYKKARNHRDLTQREMARSSDLFEHHAIARKDYESAQADFNDASTDLQNSLDALKILGVSQDEIEAADRQGAPIRPELAVRSPIAGIVVQKLVAPGQLIQAGATSCFVVSDVSTVWVQGHVFDRDLGAVRVGDTVEATNPSLPVVFHGTVQYIGAMLDPATRTTPVRIVTRNPRGLLKKDMFLDTVIHTRTTRNMLVVPTSALLHTSENEPFVYVEAAPGRFAQRLVAVGAQQDGLAEITSGLRDGEPVVSDGGVFLQFAASSQ
jgi:cobalt-zinc-cadmium efflux system membrane fusion protein